MKPIDSVCQLVINMQHYPTEDYIFGDYVMEQLNHQKITALLQLFSPENMRYVFVSQTTSTNLTSRWYQVPYKVEKIPKTLLNKWQQNHCDASLSLPTKNDYIVEDPIVYSDDEQKDESLPQCITQENGFKLWFKQEHTFKIPKGYIYIGIDSPVTLESTLHIAMTRLYVDLYTESVIEQHYNAELAGIIIIYILIKAV